MKKRWANTLLSEFHSWQKVLHWYEKLGHNFYYLYLKTREFITNKPTIVHFVYETNTQCTLKCKECHSYMPYFKSHYMVDFVTFKNEIDKLLKSVDLICSFRLQGGETLLVKDLAKIVEYACSKKQIQHIQIISNGTIIPSEELLKAMKNPKVSLSLSDYSENKNITPICKHNEIIELAKQENINYQHTKSFGGEFWFAKPSISNNKGDDKDLALKNLKSCWCFGEPKCFILFKGEMHICAPSVYYRMEFPEFKFPKDEVIDIMNTDTKTLTKKLKKFIDKKYYSLCSRCNASKGVNERFKPGEQLSEVHAESNPAIYQN